MAFRFSLLIARLGTRFPVDEGTDFLLSLGREREESKLFKLKKVELLGFKSFADSTRLVFADGIAAIVGPNGCGKSNLSDAISWVLGEQSARILRGERMADVIFNGTATRPPTGMAEVSVTLVDPEHVEAETKEPEATAQENLLPATDSTPIPANVDAGASNGHGAPAEGRPPALLHRAGEITVTRRLFRSGESEYLINGEICRLRDIQDLFMGTGLGPESYAIIEQGRIGQILSSKPSDRRAILEEAAGVSKFKTRKRLAEAKLESSRQNLARITDILEEVTKQVNSLKRQASKARRCREMQEELRGRMKVVIASHLLVLEAECRRLRDELSSLQGECSLSAQQLEELEREQKAATLRHEELESRLTQSRDQLAQGDLERHRLESSLEQARQQIAGLEARITEGGAECGQLRAQLGHVQEEFRELDRRGEQLQREQTAARQAVTHLSAQKDDLTLRVSAGESQAEACRQALLASVSEAADLRNQLVQAQEAGLALDRQAARAQAEKETAELERARLARDLEAAGSEHARGESSLAALARSVSETAITLDRAREEESASRDQLETLRQEFSGATARKQALEESLARHAYTTESVRRLLSGEIPANGHRFRPLGLLADFVKVSPGYEEVVEEFLKNDLDCVVVERHEEARSGIALLRSEGAGRSTFFVTRVPSNGHTNGHGDPDVRGARGVVAHVRDLVSFEARLGLNGDLALPALENAYVVEDATSAERLACEFPDCHFLTPTGEHYHHRLVSGGRGASAGPLALRRDFRELERRTKQLESDVRAAEAKLEDAGASVARLEEDWRRLSAEKQEAEKKAVLADEKLRQKREVSDRAAERLRVLREEAATLDAERKSLHDREQSIRARLETATAEQVRHESEVTQATQTARELRTRLDQLTPELADAQARLSALEERLRAAESTRARWLEQGDEVRARLVRLQDQCEGWCQDQRRLEAEMAAGRARLAELKDQQEAARAELRELEQESLAARARRDELSPSIDAARALLDSRRDKRSEAEVALARAESDLHHLAGQCRDELGAEPARLLEELPAETALSGEALQAAEEALRDLKARIEGLGPVNMMALEELQEAEERFRFLETQRQDLLASIEDTAQAIREIDEVSRQQFLEAFKAVNGYFAESFRTLFGGGIGEMRLSDEADPNSGLDIVAQPPGKRLQNVLLLSGGEKALAALALLIAIFRYMPSPFCILDEVDAPLDESNVDRFTRLIQQMSRHTQFILITHNKRTMEIAQLLYGVTMEDAGVSKLVSVRFEEVARETVAVPA